MGGKIGAQSAAPTIRRLLLNRLVQTSPRVILCEIPHVSDYRTCSNMEHVIAECKNAFNIRTKFSSLDDFPVVVPFRFIAIAQRTIRLNPIKIFSDTLNHD